MTYSIASIAQSEIWSLEHCIKQGVESNLSLKLSELKLLNQGIQLKESKYKQLPNVSADFNTGLSIGRNIDPTSNSFVTKNIIFGNYGIGASINLFQAGYLRNSVKYNKIELDANSKDYEQAVNDLTLQIAAQYLNVLMAEERLESSRKNYQTISLQSKNLQRLVEIGSRANADALEIKSQELKSDQAVIIAENVLAQARLQLKQMLRLDHKVDIILERYADSEFRNIKNESYNSESLYPLAESNQAQIQAAEIRLKSAGLQEKIAKTSYYPNLNGFINVNSRYSNAAVTPTEFGIKTEILKAKVNGTDFNLEYEVPTITKTKVISFTDQYSQFLGYSFGVSSRIPIFDNYFTKANVQRSKIQSEQARLNLEILKENLKLQVTQAVANVKAAIKEYEAAKKSLELSELVSKNTAKKFEIGSANSFELASAQNSYSETESTYVIAKYDLLFKQKILDLYAGKRIK
ncbi:MAG: TolC family protein [Saprospiraceae bacterium]